MIKKMNNGINYILLLNNCQRIRFKKSFAILFKFLSIWLNALIYKFFFSKKSLYRIKNSTLKN